MLSYDSPISVNGPSPVSPTTMSPNRPVISSSKPVRHTKQADIAKSNNTMATYTRDQTKHHHIWLVTGPAGCGKSTVAKHIADSLGMSYIEGDDFHPPANIEKMSNGIPLTDADRWDWLTRLRDEALAQIQMGSNGVVVTCSALKRKYRDVLRVAPYFYPGAQLHFIYLHAPEEVLLQRVAARQGHYMGATMVRSQFQILEPPTKEEKDVISVDVSRTMEEVTRDALGQAVRKLAEDAA
ncbi:thermoresistant glucokinase family carbohydrate kinase [Diaporthe sp. PMI_573]|nr:thermoresistant glucokinase family carbohydrate kinase [Diaporthaceae sp. PMI_573]